MTTKIKNSLFAALLLTVTSCSMLETEPHIIRPEDFYKSEKEVTYALAGVYGALNNEETYGQYYSTMISNPDDLCYQNRAINGGNVYWYNHNTSDPYVYQAWAMFYAGIKNANEFMHYVADSEFDRNDHYYNEARFLRAFYHFLLAQAWGDVPLRTTRVVSPEDTQLAATPQEAVLEWSVNEMESIAATFPDALDNAPSRLTRTTMEGILARVCLFTAGKSVKNVDSRHYYGRAAYWAGQVIGDGRLKLNPSYQEIFTNMISDKYDRAYNESMWEVEFLGDRSNAQRWSNGRIGDMIGLQSSGSDSDYMKWNCNYAYGMYNGSLKLWDLYYQTDRASGENQILNDLRQAWNLPPYNYTSRVIVNAQDKRDTLRNFRASYDKTPYAYDSKYSYKMDPAQPVSTDDPSVDTGNAVCRRNAGKWRREVVYEGHKTSKQLYTSVNFPLLRYADVLLMYAEAVNEYEGAPDQLAKECVRQVRDRAGIATDEGQLSGYDAFRTLVQNERGRELVFEGLRKYDLIRWGVFVGEMNAYGRQTADERWTKDSTAAYAAEIGANVQPKHIYLPIPSKELGVNKLLRQNPLW